ncbi:hypothetical protein pdam_00023634 [Pocillopora damicornis]|uniref:Uncharacterized protein n=1 Tax=Pocillopora damicornis TaxID=46731 RepID=A0A3M6TFJ4_POCDA|nr:hypothetical protein pdam_00023634 [Pocillopora damicornis]
MSRFHVQPRLEILGVVRGGCAAGMPPKPSASPVLPVFEVGQKADPKEEVNITEGCNSPLKASVYCRDVKRKALNATFNKKDHSKDCPNCRAKAQLKSAVPVKVFEVDQKADPQEEVNISEDYHLSSKAQIYTFPKGVGASSYLKFGGLFLELLSHSPCEKKTKGSIEDKQKRQRENKFTVMYPYLTPSLSDAGFFRLLRLRTLPSLVPSPREPTSSESFWQTSLKTYTSSES